MSEQAQRQLAEGLIDKVDRLEAENATLNQRIDGAAQLIAMRTADVTTLKQERDAFLEKWEAAADASLRRQAVITSMTAECDRLRQERDDLLRGEEDAERLRAACRLIEPWLGSIMFVGSDEGRQVDLALHAFRTALSPSETEEGG